MPNNNVDFNDSRLAPKVDYIKTFPKCGGEVGMEGQREKGDLSYENSLKIERLSYGITDQRDVDHQEKFKEEVNKVVKGLPTYGEDSNFFVGRNDAPYAKAKEY